MYRLDILPRAKKELLRLHPKQQARIEAAIDALQINPFLGKKLEGKFQGSWSFRVWPYRIIYRIHQRTVTVTVLKIGHRQGVYK